jgi:3'-phosphoadenosine 5'-phosphosulfate sulfotransferase (PAPS reductase)/FAD synthetase
VTIEEILRAHARPAQALDAEPIKQQLLEDLHAQKRANSRLYGVLFGAVCLVTLVAVVAVAADLINVQQARITLLTAAGITVPVMLEWMRRVVREWSQLNLLITLVSHDNESGIQALIQKLISGFPIGRGPG